MYIWHMKLDNSDIAGGIFITIVIFINAILDYLNKSTAQAIVNAVCAFLTTLLLKILYEKIKKILEERGKI